MSTAVIIPFRTDFAERERNFAWVIKQFSAHHPDWPMVVGVSPDGPFNRSAAILDGARHTEADTLVIADADCWTDPAEAVDHVGESGWSVPHCLLHRLSAESTEKVIAGEDWHGLPLSRDNQQDRRPYVGNETGTMLVIQRDLLFDVPPDTRFTTWGGEDQAWAFALNTLIGKPWRGTQDLVHLWHPPAPRLNRRVGSREGEALLNRYRHARGSKTKMRLLVNESLDLG